MFEGNKSCWCSSSSSRDLKIVVLLGLLFSPTCTLAQDHRFSQFAHRAWKTRDGFFSGSAQAVTQTNDGFIWIGTDSGLYRFDGSRFELWSSPDGQKLPSSQIIALLGASDGSLWIGMEGGLAHFADRKLFVYPGFHDDVGGLLQDRNGKIWFTRSEAGGALTVPICQALPTKIHCLDQTDGVTATSCCSYRLSQDAEGYLWVTTEGPLLRWKPGHSETYLPSGWKGTKGIETALCAVGMPDGSVLVCVGRTGAFGGLQKLSKGRWEAVKVPGFDGSQVPAFSAFPDKEGGIWVGTIKGICRIQGNGFEAFGKEDGVTGDANGFFRIARMASGWPLPAA